MITTWHNVLFPNDVLEVDQRRKFRFLPKPKVGLESCLETEYGIENRAELLAETDTESE